MVKVGLFVTGTVVMAMAMIAACGCYIIILFGSCRLTTPAITDTATTMNQPKSIPLPAAAPVFPHGCCCSCCCRRCV